MLAMFVYCTTKIYIATNNELDWYIWEVSNAKNASCVYDVCVWGGGGEVDIYFQTRGKALVWEVVEKLLKCVKKKKKDELFI